MTTHGQPTALAEIVGNIDACRARGLALTEDVEQKQADRHPKANEWSIGEVVDHLIRAEGASAWLIVGMAKRTTPDTPRYPASVRTLPWQPRRRAVARRGP